MGKRAGKPQCSAALHYSTAQSGRKMADGVKRYHKGDRCLRNGNHIDRYGDSWCGIHARASNVIINYGPLRLASKNRGNGK